MKAHYSLLLTGVFLGLFPVIGSLACDETNSNDDIDPDPGPAASLGPFAAASVVENIRYLGVIPSLGIGTYSLDNAVEGAGALISVYQNKLYALPDLETGGTVVEVYRIEGADLVLEGTIDTPEGSTPTDILVVDDTKAYMALPGIGFVWEIDLETLETVDEIELTGYAVDDDDPDTPADANPEPTAMAVRDGKLYVVLSQLYNALMMGREGVYVAVVDMETNTVEKVISDERGGYAYGGRPGGTGSEAIVDENGDLYISTKASWGFVSGQKGGWLRIPAGEEAFDPDWEMDLATFDLDIDGETVNADYPNFSVYAGGGIVYASVHIPAYDSDPPDWANDRSLGFVKVDLYNRTVDPLPLPTSNAYAGGVTMDGDYLAATMYTDEGTGIHVYDTVSETVVASPAVVTDAPVYVLVNVD